MMERLTFEGNFCDIAQCAEIPGGSFCEDGACSEKKTWERLKAYEDTGLTPKDLKAHFTAETVLKLCGQILSIDPDRLRELAKADKDGRLVVLPCKPLDTVYSLFCGEIVEKRIGAITINGYTNPHIWVELDCDFLAMQTKRWDLAVGKEFYLSHEEAEQALKEAKKDG